MRMTVMAITACLLGTAAGRTPDALWLRTLDWGSFDYGCGIASRGDAIAVGGYAWNGANMDELVVRLNQAGDTVWSRRYATERNDYAGSVCLDAQSNVLVSGYSLIYGDRMWCGLTAKYDSVGDLKWFRADTGYLPLAITCDAAGDCYLSGSHVLNDTEYDFWLAKLDTAGETIWTRTFDFSSVDYGGPLEIDESGNILACVDIGDSTYDCLTLKLTPDGYIIWTRRFDLGSDNFCSGLALDPSGCIIVAGATILDTGYDALVLKYDSNGTALWSRTFDFGPDDELSGACCDSAGDIYVAGYSGVPGAYQCLFMKLDSLGDTLWTGTYGGPYDDQARGIACDPDGNPIIVGIGADSTTAATNLLVAKYSAFTGVAESPCFSLGPVRPRGTITAAPDFLLSVPSSGQYEISLCDLTGRVRRQLFHGSLCEGAHRLSLPGHPAGNYVVRVTAPGGRVSCQRLVVVK